MTVGNVGAGVSIAGNVTGVEIGGGTGTTRMMMIEPTAAVVPAGGLCCQT